MLIDTDNLVPGLNDEALLSPDFLRKLEQISLVVSKVFAGHQHGERRSTRRGSSVEFADFRDYVHGDDLRSVDWNSYARLEKLFLKLYVEEEDVRVHLLIDTSRSMGFGEPSKLLAAKRICAALGYIALANYDSVSVTAFSGRATPCLRPLRGKGQAHTLFSTLQGLSAAGESDFARALKEFALLTRTPGLVIVVSDFLANGLEDGLRALVGRKFSPVLMQVLTPEEINPLMVGDLRLVDAETGETREVSMTTGLLTRYRQRLEEHREFIQRLGNRYGVHYLPTTTAEPFEHFVLNYLRMRQIVR